MLAAPRLMPILSNVPKDYFVHGGEIQMWRWLRAPAVDMGVGFISEDGTVAIPPPDEPMMWAPVIRMWSRMLQKIERIIL